jgi:hypothetical protein
VVAVEVLAAGITNSSAFWDIMSRSPLKVNLRLGLTYRLHLQGGFLAGFLLDLFLDTHILPKRRLIFNGFHGLCSR